MSPSSLGCFMGTDKTGALVTAACRLLQWNPLNLKGRGKKILGPFLEAEKEKCVVPRGLFSLLPVFI